MASSYPPPYRANIALRANRRSDIAATAAPVACLVTIAVCVVAGSLSAAESNKDEPGRKAAFLDAYKPEYLRLRDYYSTAIISCKGQVRLSPQNVERVEYTYTAAGASYRIDVVKHSTERGEVRLGNVTTPALCFAIRAASGGSAFTVSSIVVNPSQQRYASDLVALRLNYSVPFAPYSFVEHDLYDLLSSSDVEIRQVDMQGNNEVVVVIDVNRGERSAEATFVFARNRHFALNRGVWKLAKSATAFVVEIKYDDEDDGIPRVRSYERYAQAAGRDEKRSWHTFQTVSFVRAPNVDMDTFTLSAYGLPDPAGTTEQRSHMFWLLLLNLPIACIVCWWLARKLRSRRMLGPDRSATVEG